MACNCPDKNKKQELRPASTQYQVMSGGEVVFRTFNDEEADRVSARWPGSTVEPVTVR